MGADRNRGLVLVVEDEPVIADVLRLNLRAAGYSVETVSDGKAALAATRTSHPSALILDVMLPELDGVEVCRQLRAEGDWTPILFVTARDDEVDRIVRLELGADDYITKPFSPREVVARLGGVVRRTRGRGRQPDASLRSAHHGCDSSSGVRQRRRNRFDCKGVRLARLPAAASGKSVHT